MTRFNTRIESNTPRSKTIMVSTMTRSMIIIVRRIRQIGHSCFSCREDGYQQLNGGGSGGASRRERQHGHKRDRRICPRMLVILNCLLLNKRIIKFSFYRIIIQKLFFSEAKPCEDAVKQYVMTPQLFYLGLQMQTVWVLRGFARHPSTCTANSTWTLQTATRNVLDRYKSVIICSVYISLYNSKRPCYSIFFSFQFAIHMSFQLVKHFVSVSCLLKVKKEHGLASCTQRCINSITKSGIV